MIKLVQTNWNDVSNRAKGNDGQHKARMRNHPSWRQGGSPKRIDITQTFTNTLSSEKQTNTCKTIRSNKRERENERDGPTCLYIKQNKQQVLLLLLLENKTKAIYFICLSPKCKSTLGGKCPHSRGVERTKTTIKTLECNSLLFFFFCLVKLTV